MIADLVGRARDGDPEAYTELVRRFQDAVYATAYQAVLDPEAARDLAQDTFVRAYEALGSLRDPASFPGWVIRICRNLAASWLRRPDRAWVSIDGLHVPAPDIAPAIASDDLVSRALSALPEENRLALSLFAVNGYTYDEVAELTGVRTTTVKGRIHRAKRKLAAEVFGMVEESLKNKAPQPEFTVETVRRSLDRARELVQSQQLVRARAAADEVLETLPKLDVNEEERRKLREEGLGLVQRATLFADNERWAEATREALRLCDERGDLKGVADHLAALSHHARGITGPESTALLERAIDLYRELGEPELLAQKLFFVGWGDVARGEAERGFRQWEEARSALQPLPYGAWHACFDATDEFLRLAAGRLDPARHVTWGTGCDSLQTDGERLAFLGQPGYSTHTTRQADDMAKFESGFCLFGWLRWFPWRGPEPGYEEELPTFSFTGNPTHTRLWVEMDGATVETPAGRFADCLLVRATVAESPADHGTESQQRDLNRMWCGERWLWLARGVGPVAYRHEQADGVVVHPVLTHHECPEKKTEWVPLVAGARWEFAPADPPETFDAQVVVRLTHLLEDGTGYLATSMFGNLHDDQPS